MFDSDFFSINKNKLLIFFSITLTLALSISLIMVLVFTCQQKHGTSVKAISPDAVKDKEKSVSITDFLFEDRSLNIRESRYYLFREKLSKWNEDQVNKYFIPPAEILREYFRKKNDNRINELFSSIE